MKQITEGVIFLRGRDEFIPDSHVYVIGEPSSGDLSIVDAGLMGKGNYKTESIKKALAETERRRDLQVQYNTNNSIIPQTIVKPIEEKKVDIKDTRHIPKKEIPDLVTDLESEMAKAADRLDFEYAILLRDKIKRLKERESG